MAPEDTLRVFVAASVAPPAEDEGGLHDVAGVVDLSSVGVRLGRGVLDHPSHVVGNIAKAVVVECEHPPDESRVVQQVRQLRQR